MLPHPQPKTARHLGGPGHGREQTVHHDYPPLKFREYPTHAPALLNPFPQRLTQYVEHTYEVHRFHERGQEAYFALHESQVGHSVVDVLWEYVKQAKP